MDATYPETMTMRAARAIYFHANAFGSDGGYDDAWVDFELGTIPLPFRNTAARVRAVRYHDLHHILTGYATDIVGEFEISAWELAAGCKDFHAAWVLNLGGIAGGLLRAPGRTFRAFVRGRRDVSLYGSAFEPLLDRTVGDLRADHVHSTPNEAARAADMAAFVLAGALGLVVGVLLFAVVLAFVPFGLRNRAKRAAEKATPAPARVAQGFAQELVSQRWTADPASFDPERSARRSPREIHEV